MEEKIKELEQFVEELSNELASGMYQTIQILSNIATFTENFYEGSHSRFVSEKSAMLADELGLNDDMVTEIKIAGLLHDIGKIGYMDSSLYKYPSEMSSSEYKRYTMHPGISVKILEPYNAFSSICEIIGQHHEKLDGSGFPNHLQNNEISPGAKIILVVDTFHNAIYKKQRDRTYNNASTAPYTSTAAFLESTKDKYANTMNYLYKKRGILFDKQVVEAFIRMMELERTSFGKKSVLRVPVNQIVPGMIFAEDYFTKHGMLIAAKGETTKPEMVKALVRFAEAGEIPTRILVMK